MYLCFLFFLCFYFLFFFFFFFLLFLFFFFFFFQAEDGIRDKLVTGVQTCALPILSELKPQVYKDPRPAEYFTRFHERARTRDPDFVYELVRLILTPVMLFFYRRSEERRVGKECRSRWSPDQ